MFIYLNGSIIKQEDARISPFDHGYIYGLGLFETLRVYDGHPFLLDDHLMRLRQSLVEMKIEFKFTKEGIEEILRDTLNANQLKDAYIRFNVSAGEGEIGLQVETYTKPTIIVFAKPIPPFVQEKQMVLLQTLRNTPEGTFRLKSHHFLNNIYAKREIGPDPSKEGIFLTKEGYLSEGITSNLFWIKNNTFYTPSLETGILNGITRQYLIKVMETLGYAVSEGLFTPNDLIKSDEIFVTNSIQEIVPINQLGDVDFPGSNGIHTKRLQLLYGEHRKTLWSRNEL